MSTPKKFIERRHPRTLDHTPGHIREIAQIVEDMSQWEMMDGTDFDNLQNAANLLNDWADTKSGIIHEPKPRT